MIIPHDAMGKTKYFELSMNKDGEDVLQLEQ